MEYLGALAPELLGLILEQLVPEPIPTNIFHHDDNTTWPLLVEEKYDEVDSAHLNTWRRQRLDLLSLSRASRGLHHFCKPYLWKSIAVDEEARLDLLIRDLRSKPDIQGYVEGVYIIGPRPASDDVSRVWYPNEAIDTLISHTPNVADILCAIQRDAVFDFMDTLPPVGKQAQHTFHKTMIPTVTSRKPLPAPLQNLSSLRFRVHAQDLACSAQWPVNVDVFPLLPFLPHLTTLEIFGNINFWSAGTWIGQEFLEPFHLSPDTVLPTEAEPYIRFLQDGQDSDAIYRSPILGPDGPKLPGVKHLRLYNTSLSDHGIAALIKSCPNLETLLVKVEDEANPPYIGEPPPVHAGHGIDAALLEARALKSLALFGCCARDAAPGIQPPVAKSPLPLSELPLTELMVDFYALFGNPACLTLDHADQFAALIPHSVRGLELVPQWGSGTALWLNLPESEEYKEYLLYARDLIFVVRGLLNLLREGRHQLRHLTLCLRGPVEDPISTRDTPWIPYIAIPPILKGLLQKPRDAAKRAGVREVTVRGCWPSFIDLEWDQGRAGPTTEVLSRYARRTALAMELEESTLMRLYASIIDECGQ